MLLQFGREVFFAFLVVTIQLYLVFPLREKVLAYLAAHTRRLLALAGVALPLIGRRWHRSVLVRTGSSLVPALSQGLREVSAPSHRPLISGR